MQDNNRSSTRHPDVRRGRGEPQTDVHPSAEVAQRRPHRRRQPGAGARDAARRRASTDDDLARPLVGVANTWIEIGPCNYHLRELAVHVKAGVRDAGGTPIEFNTVSISDGITMGSEGMRPRSSAARSSPTRSSWSRAATCSTRVVVLVGCDKTIPAAVDGAGAARHARPRPLRRLDRARAASTDRDVTIQDVFEAVGAHAAGTDSRRATSTSSSDHACPGAGACGGQFTANTMATSCEFLGLSPIGSASVPADDAAKARRRARRPARCVMDLLRRGLPAARRSSRATRSRTPSRRSPPPAARPTPCCTCSRSRARPACRSTSTTSTAISARVPLLADLKPGGRFVADRPARGRRHPGSSRGGCSTAGLLHGDAITVTGRTIGEEARDAVETPGQEVVRPLGDAAEADRRPGHPARATSRPRAASSRSPGTSARTFAGPARVFDSEEDAFAAVQAGAHQAPATSS